MAADSRIGTTIKKRRQVLGMTQQDLADALGVSKSTVANWESGKHFPLRYLGKVEAVLGISLSPAGDDEPPIPPDLQRRLDRLTPAERAYVIERLRRQAGNGANEAPE